MVAQPKDDKYRQTAAIKVSKSSFERLIRSVENPAPPTDELIEMMKSRFDKLKEK